jgi:flagellar FliJ protein
MRRFRFSLETVLRVKRGREEKIQQEFSAILERHAHCLREIGVLERSMDAMVREQSEGPRAVLNGATIEIFERSRKALLERLGWQRHSLSSIDSELELKRLELVAASRERKVLEKLEESQYEAYLAELNREEQAFLDELAAHNSLQLARTS